MKAHRRSRDIAVLSLWWMVNATPLPLYPGNNLVPLFRRVCGPHGRSGRVREISPPPRIDPRTLQPVASYTDYTILFHSLA